MPSPAAHRLLCVALLAAGCGFGQLQTARTTPPGYTRLTFGHTFVSSGLENGREPPSIDPKVLFPPAFVPPHLELRRGLRDHVDIGARLTFGIGLQGDVKVNLMPTDFPFALAISAGAGVAVNLGDRGIYVLQLPVMLSASYEIGTWFTPYAGIAYRGLWMWGADDPTLPNYNYTAPTGRGEGLLTPVGGIALGRRDGYALLLEYGRLVTAWHDPGHGYTFVPAHLVSIGIRVGRGPAFER